MCGILCYLRNSFQDKEFGEFRRVLDAEMKRMKLAGIHSKACKAEPLSIKEEKLFEKGVTIHLRF